MEIELQEISTNYIKSNGVQEQILIINQTEQIIHNDGSCLNIHVHILQRKKEKHKHLFTTKRIGFMKLFLFFFAVSFVAIGKIYGTVIFLLYLISLLNHNTQPSENTYCIEDPILALFYFFTKALIEYPGLILILQYIYAIFLDSVFYATFIYW